MQQPNLDMEPQDINIVSSKKARKAVIATGIGNAMEWFDFGLYAYLAVIISQLFFAGVDNSSLQLVFTFATFAVAFLVRPIGGIFFGKIGDKYGRKIVLSTTIIIMAIATLLIGLLPTYEQIGIWAPILLLVARMIQGFSTGGEYSGAMVYIAESSPDKKRGMLGSGLEIGSLSGFIAASGLVTILTLVLSDAQMLAWGWRIPFFIAAPIGLIGLYLRRHLDESPIFEEMEQAQQESDEEPLTFKEILKHYKKDMLLSMINKKKEIASIDNISIYIDDIFVYGCNLIGISAFSEITDISRTTIYKYITIPNDKYALYTLKQELPMDLKDKIIDKLGI